MKNRVMINLLLVLIAFSPMAYLAMVWPTVPDMVPTHFDGSFKPNAYSTKIEFLFIQLFICVLGIGLYFLLENIQKLDPKRAGKTPATVFHKLAVGELLFMTALGFVTTRLGIHPDKGMEHLLFPLVGLLFVFLGNIMYNIKPNYFAGIRVPWTLASDYNWRKTHQLAGSLWFGGGILITMVSFILPGEVFFYVLLSIIAVMVVIPVGYSFLLFRKEQVNGDQRP
jgi:uncharacterized membrane protein